MTIRLASPQNAVLTLVLSGFVAQCSVPDPSTARYVDAAVNSSDVPNVAERSCAEVQAAMMARGVTPVDGRYAIDPDGIGGQEQPFVVFCDRMTPGAGSPREYLDVDPGNNFRQVWLEGLVNSPCQCQWFKRAFSRVRLVISTAPIRYAIDGLDFTYSVQTVGPQIMGRPMTCPVDGRFPPLNQYALVCENQTVSNVTPNSSRGNEYGSADSCVRDRPFGNTGASRVLLAGTGFRVSREDLSKYVPVEHDPASSISDEVLLSTNAGQGYELQLNGFCARIAPPRYEELTHAVLEVERDIPTRSGLGEDCANPWLLDDGWLGGDVQSMNASAAALCLPAFSRPVRYYEVRVPANRSRVIRAKAYSQMVDIFVRVLDRCGATDCLSDTSQQVTREHELTISNPSPTDRSFIVAVSGRTPSGDTFYRISAGAPAAL